MFNVRSNCDFDQMTLAKGVSLKTNSIERKMGELLFKIPCQRIKINVTIGQNLPCFINHLTIKWDNNLYGIKAFTRTIVNISQLIEVECKQSPTYLKIKPGLYIGNSGTGMEIIKVMNSITSSYHIHGLYSRMTDGLIDDWEGQTVETLHLENLALDSEVYEIHITKTW